MASIRLRLSVVFFILSTLLVLGEYWSFDVWNPEKRSSLELRISCQSNAVTWPSDALIHRALMPDAGLFSIA